MRQIGVGCRYIGRRSRIKTVRVGEDELRAAGIEEARRIDDAVEVRIRIGDGIRRAPHREGVDDQRIAAGHAVGPGVGDDGAVEADIDRIVGQDRCAQDDATAGVVDVGATCPARNVEDCARRHRDGA